MAETREPSRLGGCLLLLLTCVLAGALFVVNGMVVRTIYDQLLPSSPAWLKHPKVGQVLMFTVPVALLVCQWWLLDFITDRVSREQDGEHLGAGVEDHAPERRGAVLAPVRAGHPHP